jgi:hypothetical protein
MMAPRELTQLNAGADPELGERIAQMGSHGVGRDVQLLCHRTVGSTPRSQVDHLELGVGETVPARLSARLADNATFHT